MSSGRTRVCPVEKAGSLDNKLRRWIQPPDRIVGPFIREGMTVLDLGCGPGFFTVDMARMVGRSGRVIAADLQEGMLHKVRDKIQGTELAHRIALHRCGPHRIGVTESVDFILAFYMIHEITDQNGLFSEIESILAPDGKVFIIEPPFHVSGEAFERMIESAGQAGLILASRPRVFLSKTAVFEKA